MISKLRELSADGLEVPLAAAQLSALGHQCTARQVRRWKETNGIRNISDVTNAELDGIVRDLRAKGRAGDNDGYRWVHVAVNKLLAPRKVGVGRVRLALTRVMPQEVAARKALVEKRLIRRVYTRDYYQHASHLDYNCKATLPGGVRIYTYGHVRTPISHMRE